MAETPHGVAQFSFSGEAGRQVRGREAFEIIERSELQLPLLGLLLIHCPGHQGRSRNESFSGELQTG